MTAEQIKRNRNTLIALTELCIQLERELRRVNEPTKHGRIK